jgi:hypothetical protein
MPTWAEVGGARERARRVAAPTRARVLIVISFGKA